MYGLDLREAFQSMPAVDLVDLINGLDHWGPHEENTALLLEAERYKLDLDWADRTVDPESPEVKTAKREAERAGIKPPDHPIIPPIALRPRDLADVRLEQYLRAVESSRTPPREKVHVSLDEWEQAVGLA